MAATQQNATLYQGASVVIQITVDDPDELPVDMEGRDVFYRIARRETNVSVIALSATDMTIASDVVSVPLTTARTMLLEPTRFYYHELYIVEAGERRVLTTGWVTVLPAQAALHVSA